MKKQTLPARMLGGRQNERGISLIIALFALLALMTAATALIRSAGTTNTVASNMSFRQSNVQASDVGVENALNALTTTITAPDAVYPLGCSGSCSYYPTRQAVDSSGIPTSINWASVASTTVDSSYSVQYVIDRQCDGPTPVTDVVTNCMNTQNPTSGSKKVGAVVFTSADQVYYRVTVRVVGPRNTQSFVQTIFAK